MSAVADIVVVGSLHLDIMVEAPGRPRLGETLAGSAWSLNCGGKGGNQAVHAARHGATVAMVGAVGGDDFGRRLLAHLRDHGVDASRIAVHRDARSGMSVAITEPSGDYGAVIVSGANLMLDAGAAARAADVIATARVLLLQNEVPEEANLAAAAAARAGGCRVILNAAPARPLIPDLAGLLDILVVNALEAEALCGVAVTDLAAARRAASLLAPGIDCVVVTAGGAGLAWRGSADGVTEALPAHRVAVVSTHGAGDAFTGALAARLAAGHAMADAVRYAGAAAALLVAASDAAGPSAVDRLLAGMPAEAALGP